MLQSKDSFEIQLTQFAGPFDLLLFFIERDELDIQDIPITKITDDFLDYLHKMNSLNIELASEFIYVAATLMRIKAKMLLPRIEIDEAGNDIDLKQDLIQKLIEYKRFKQVAEVLRGFEDERLKKERRGSIIRDLELASQLTEHGDELSSLNLYRMMIVYEKLMKRYLEPGSEVKHTVLQYPYTIEQQKQMISNLLTINNKMDFKGILSKSDNKVHFVYNFLAVLEMLQQELIMLQSGLGYNNFWISSRIKS